MDFAQLKRRIKGGGGGGLYGREEKEEKERWEEGKVGRLEVGYQREEMKRAD